MSLSFDRNVKTSLRQKLFLFLKRNNDPDQSIEIMNHLMLLTGRNLAVKERNATLMASKLRQFGCMMSRTSAANIRSSSTRTWMFV